MFIVPKIYLQARASQGGGSAVSDYCVDVGGLLTAG